MIDASKHHVRSEVCDCGESVWVVHRVQDGALLPREAPANRGREGGGPWDPFAGSEPTHETMHNGERCGDHKRELAQNGPIARAARRAGLYFIKSVDGVTVSGGHTTHATRSTLFRHLS